MRVINNSYEQKGGVCTLCHLVTADPSHIIQKHIPEFICALCLHIHADWEQSAISAKLAGE